MKKVFCIFTVVLATILLIMSVWWSPDDPPINKVGATILFALIGSAISWTIGKLGESGYFSLFPAAVALYIIILGGGEALQRVFDQPALEINIENNTTYVAPPSDIEDPALRDYETKKMSFEEDWIGNAFGGTWLLFSFGLAFATLINIQLKKMGVRFVTVPINLVIFVVGSLILVKFLWPSGYADQATIDAQNTAIIIGAVGPFIWSSAMQVIYWTTSQARGYANKNQFTGAFFAAFAYPLFGGIFQLFDLHLISKWIMADALVNTQMTVQLWTELELSGKFIGMFLPAVVSSLLSIMFEMFMSSIGLLNQDED